MEKEFYDLFQATDSETYEYFFEEERQSLFSRVFGECYGICVVRKQRRPYMDDEEDGLIIEPSTIIEIEKEKTFPVKFLRYIFGRDGIKCCPFCGSAPEINPSNPDEDGNAWGSVECVNKECPSRPSVRDGVRIADDRGSDSYKKTAIKRWNKRK